MLETVLGPKDTAVNKVGLVSTPIDLIFQFNTKKKNVSMNIAWANNGRFITYL